MKRSRCHVYWGLVTGPEIIIQAKELTAFAENILVALKVPRDRASLAAQVLIGANLRGIDSHGVQLLQYYAGQLEHGDVDPQTVGHVISETGACLLYDGENGLGHPISQICCNHAIRLAGEHGLGMVVVRESNHFGAAYFWARMMSATGQIGIVICNASPMVPPWQGKETRFGTNPICVSVPGGREEPWLLDMATTTVAAGKLYKAGINGVETIPAGWAMDSDGVPTTDTQKALKGLLMPLGGYKGSGLAMMVEILCAVLSGGAMSTQLGGIRLRGRPMRVNQMFLAIDPARFLPLGEFTERMDWLIRTVKAAAPATGYEEVLVAGEPERRSEEIRSREGIPVGAGTWKALGEVAGRYGVPCPIAGSQVDNLHKTS
ncbi:MAG: Ldh family oxidoreductase [Bryobacteraceae bacterium]